MSETHTHEEAPVAKRAPRKRKPRPVVKILGELGAHDTGHLIEFTDPRTEQTYLARLGRVMHEGGSTGALDTYMTLRADNGLTNITCRIDHDAPVTVYPIETDESAVVMSAPPASSPLVQK